MLASHPLVRPLFCIKNIQIWIMHEQSTLMVPGFASWTHYFCSTIIPNTVAFVLLKRGRSVYSRFFLRFMLHVVMTMQGTHSMRQYLQDTPKVSHAKNINECVTLSLGRRDDGRCFDHRYRLVVALQSSQTNMKHYSGRGAHPSV